MGFYFDTKTFRSGNSIAVRLPSGLGFAEGVPVRVERVGTDIHVRPLRDAENEKRRLAEMIAALRAVGPPDEVEIRDPDIFPDRPGLYD